MITMNSAIEYLNDLKHHLDKSNVIKQSHYFAGVFISRLTF